MHHCFLVPAAKQASVFFLRSEKILLSMSHPCLEILECCKELPTRLPLAAGSRNPLISPEHYLLELLADELGISYSTLYSSYIEN